MSLQEGESAEVSPEETRSPLPEFLRGRAAWIGLGAVTSLLMASVAFAQGAWTDGREAGGRTPAVEPDKATEALSPPSALEVAEDRP